jgi:hypothetical protein
MTDLPGLEYENFLPTRNYLQNICLALGAIQRGFLPKEEHDWQYGLEVSMRGISTQEFTAGGQKLRITLDFVKYKVRIGDTNWLIDEYAAPEIYNNLKVWFESRGFTAEFERPEFIEGPSQFIKAECANYAQALWRLDRQFAGLKASRQAGLTSPLLLYPHHFDLSLVWFPYDDHRQIALGFSTGDATIVEPYIYCTMYPNTPSFNKIKLPKESYWQSKGFEAAILPYAALQGSGDPTHLMQTFAADLFDRATQLLT